MVGTASGPAGGQAFEKLDKHAFIRIENMGIKALINGKINSTRLTEKSEDLLTSNIFQNLSYLPFKEGIYNILKTAKNIKNQELPVPYGDFDFDIIYWPKYKKYESGLICEPDLIIELKKNNSIKYIIMVEMKFKSPKSSTAIYDENDQYQENSDQLEKEISLLNKIYSETENKYFLYITQSFFPKKDIETTEELIKEKGVIFHTNYLSIYKSFKPNDNNPIISDILKMFEYFRIYGFIKWRNYSEIDNYFKKYNKRTRVYFNSSNYNKVNMIREYLWK